MSRSSDTSDQQVHDLLTAIERAGSPYERELLEDELVRSCLPLAERLAMRYRNRGADLDDLVAVANLALVNAVRRFEPSRGTFHGFAVATILGEIKKHFRDHCWMIRPTRAVQELQPRVRQAQEELLEHGQEPSRDLVASRLGISVDDVGEAMSASSHYSPQSLDAPSGASGRPLVETVSGVDDAFLAADDLLTAAPGCADLTDDERHLLRLRFYDDLTQQRIAEEIGVSQMQVSRRLAAIIAKIRAGASIADAA
jgi:RNA polymerase sigma-B factor